MRDERAVRYYVAFPVMVDGNGGCVGFDSPQALVRWLVQMRHRLPSRLHAVIEIVREGVDHA